MPPRRVILVVGSTGQTGVHVARCLSRDGCGGSEANAQPDCMLFLTRSLEKGESKLQGLLTGADRQPGQPECHLLQCADVSDSGSLRQSFDQAAKIAGGYPVSHVVNALGTSGRSDSPEKAIFLATRNLMQESVRVGVKRFVHCGVAYVTRPEAKVAKILNTIAKNIMGYHALAELEIRRQAHGSGVDYIIVRPGGLDHGNPGDGFEVSQGDDIKGASIRRSRLGELLCKALDTDVLPYRPGGGTTMETCGMKSKNSEGPVEIGWGGFPKNKTLEEDVWKGMLSELTPDPTWKEPNNDIMAEHRQSARKFQMTVGCGCFACVSLVLGSSLAAVGVLP